MADLSLVRNSTRDMAESMRRFEKNWDRMARQMKAAMDDGHSEAEITATMNEALKGHPDLVNRVRIFMARLTDDKQRQRIRDLALDGRDPRDPGQVQSTP